ncbi:endolytic transglycosylase MltG [Beijerinckia indica]|uniref:Endolytic murein transglycosylase n=1 Tax=Beijerinckia indica subsp. indica (strain ATCC 9039 / DSM 1715 / NCIMB 8712) TaxID=395963 RepID=B2IHC4_BEII9|nr:endolytic transglycosylase MltG [Beijerinckia indica]ACB95909.1 aminodeoxychorismate lyase [Beijerinckia indica subsp. indica ATCC 9039]
MAPMSSHIDGLPEQGYQPILAVGGLFGRGTGPQSPNEALQPQAAPPPPPNKPSNRRRGRLSAFSGFLSFLLIAAIGIMVVLIWTQRKMQEPGPLTADRVVFIAPGTEVPDIIARLDREGIIDSPLGLNIALLVEGKRSKVKAGEYLFKQGASLRDVMDTLVSGKQVLHALTLPEGLTSTQIVARIMEDDVLQGDIRDVPKEGTILPETYKFTRNSLRADLVRKMQEDQKRIVDQVWQRRASDLPLKSPYELVILASIVEKETGKADERPHVASVFLNRLQKRMRLQSDPTIVYGLVGGKGTLGRAILRSEVEKPTPYNTYVIDGLPPGPIANPGRAALEAVANPSRTRDLYFVADGTGGHVFAETLDQHVRNVQKWRQIEHDAKEKQQAPDVDKIAPTPDQHGEADFPGAVYGGLPPALATPSAAALSSLRNALVKEQKGGALSAKAGEAKLARASAAAAQKYGLGPGLDELGLSIRGVPSGAEAAAALDGPISAETAEAAGGSMVLPVSAARRAEQKARAMRLGLEPGRDELPAEAPADSSVAVLTQPQQEGRAAVHGPHHGVTDASEGKSFDPLLDKTYDLNYAKTVPVIGKNDPRL